MTEQTLGSPAVSQEAPAESSFNATSSNTSGHETEGTVSQQPEKQISQSDVGRIAGAIRKESHDKGYHKGYQDALAKFQQQTVSSQVEPSAQQAGDSQQSPQNSLQNMQETISKQIAETLRKEREEQGRVAQEKQLQDYITQLGAQLRPKIEAAKAKHEDFDSAVQKLHLDKVPHVLEWVNTVPNAGEVLYDLAKNPQKLAILNSLHAPELAISQVQEIARSLDNNQKAQDKSLPKEPLGSINPSIVGKQGGELSGQDVTDVARKKYRF